MRWMPVLVSAVYRADCFEHAQRSAVHTKITGILKDPETEEIKADSFSFYFNQGVGLGPKVSHTLSPDTLTNRDVSR